MNETTTKTPPITHEEIRCELGDWVIPHLTKNDHRPLERWNVAERTPIIYKISTIGFDKIFSIISKFTSAPKNAF